MNENRHVIPERREAADLESSGKRMHLDSGFAPSARAGMTRRDC